MSWRSRRLRELDRTADRGAASGAALYRQVAVALRYGEHDPAPRLVAKGRGPVADAILRLAAEHDVPLRKDPDLTLLLEKLELYEEIPHELYRVVAEILIWLYAANAAYSR